MHEKQTFPELTERHIVSFCHSQLNLEPGTDNFYRVFNEHVEKPMLKALMNYHRNNISKVSRTLGINRQTVTNKLKRYGLHKVRA